MAQMVKNLPAMRKTWFWSLGWEDPLEEGMATHCSILVWRIPMDRWAWWATVLGVTKSRTRLSDQAHIHLTRLWSPPDQKIPLLKLLMSIKVLIDPFMYYCCSVAKSCLTLWDPINTRLSCPSLPPRVCSNSCPSSQWLC